MSMNSSTPVVESLTYRGTTSGAYSVTSGSTTSIYVKKYEAYDSLGVLEFLKDSYNLFTVTWKNEFVSSLPSGYKTATQVFSPGTANTAQVLTGYTFSSANGTNLSGTMPNRGNLNWSPSSSTSYTVPSGYYSGGTLNSANAYNAGLSAGRQNNGYVAFWYWGGGLEVGNSGGSQCILGYINSNLATKSGNAIVFRYAGTYTMYWTFTSSDGSSSLHRVYNGSSAQLYANGNWYEFAASGTNISVGANSSLYFTVNNGGKLGVSISVYRH